VMTSSAPKLRIDTNKPARRNTRRV
jgi:hypothetical protein